MYSCINCTVLIREIYLNKRSGQHWLVYLIFNKESTFLAKIPNKMRLAGSYAGFEVLIKYYK